MKLIVIALLIGVLGGTVAALCGVGGGIIMVPAFVYFLGMERKLAVATSMAVIAPTAAVSIFNYTADKLVQWNVFIPTAIGAVIAAYFISDKMKEFSNATLSRTFAVILILVGISMLFKKA